KIVAVGNTEDLKKDHSNADVVIDAKNKAIMPGLINLHFHSHFFTRGLFQSETPEKTLDELLCEFFYPLAKKMSPEDVFAEASIAYVDSIKSGTTCVNDIYWRIGALADAANETGLRAVICSEALDKVESENIEDNEKGFLEKNNLANGRIKIWFGIEWLPVCSNEMVMKVRELANKYKTGIHVHLNESMWEVEKCKKMFGKRPIEQAYDLGVLGEDCVAAHCVWVSDREMRILKDTNTHVVHNPVSNLILANGFARIPEMLSTGINVGLGTDAPNNNSDMFETMKLASIMQKGYKLDITQMSYDTVIEMATINGAKALGMEKEIGSIEIGKKADMILVNLRSTKFEPIVLGQFSNIIPNMVYSAHGENVDTSIIDGKIVMQNRELKTVDEEKVIDNAKKTMNSVVNKIF
ncbi:amidohydrolase, partial [Candidatus Bathyarchaeota archaeon]|nr:amidohydrolase [Candidatus Bathyarchaeota archaeon]